MSTTSRTTNSREDLSLSPTLAMNEEIARRRAAGLKTVPLGFGEASIPVHPDLVAQLRLHAPRGDYGPVAGAGELLAAAAGYWSRRGIATSPEQVVSGPGSKPLLYAIFQALGGPVLLPKPSWVSYAAQNALLGQEVRLVEVSGTQGGVPDPDRLAEAAVHLRAEGRPASAVLVTIPDNPTGTVATPDLVRRLCAVAEEQDLVVVSDEIYLELVHDDTRTVVTPAQVAPERTITTTGLSKSLAVGGWRIGVARLPAPYVGVMRRVLMSASEIWSAPSQPVQQAAAWALTEPPILRDRIAASRALHGRVARAVADIFRQAGAEVAPPTAGFYAYPDFSRLREPLSALGIETSAELASAMLDQYGVATLPGSAFGDDPRRLALRVATPMLYGSTDDERYTALTAERPEELPWIAENLATLRKALSAVLGHRATS